MLKRTIFAIAIFSMLGTPSFAQTNINADLQKKLKEAMEEAQKITNTWKGWTCRSLEDGGRLHVVDASGTKKMNGIPSSKARLEDETTPLDKLPECAPID